MSDTNAPKPGPILLSVDINAEDVQRQVVNAIAASAIGANVKKQLDELLAKTNSWSNSIIDKAIEEHLRSQIANLVGTIVREHEAEIRAIVATKLTPEILEKMSNDACARLLNTRSY